MRTIDSLTSQNLYFPICGLLLLGSVWKGRGSYLAYTLQITPLCLSLNGQHSGSRQITWPVGWLAEWNNAWNGASSTGCGTRRLTSWSITLATTQPPFACPQPTLRGALDSFLVISSLSRDTEHRGFPGIETGLSFVKFEWLLCLRLLHLYLALNQLSLGFDSWVIRHS